MKLKNAFIDGMPIVLHVPETLLEYKEGARSSKGELKYNEGYLFYFGKTMFIQMENSGVNQDLVVLYFNHLLKYGVVTETSILEKNSGNIITSKGTYSVSLELRKDFIEQNKIKPGSMIILKD